MTEQVDHHRQIQEPVCLLNEGDVRTPNLVDPLDPHVPQLLRINLVFVSRYGDALIGKHRLQPHLLVGLKAPFPGATSIRCDTFLGRPRVLSGATKPPFGAIRRKEHAYIARRSGASLESSGRGRDALHNRRRRDLAQQAALTGDAQLLVHRVEGCGEVQPTSPSFSASRVRP